MKIKVCGLKYPGNIEAVTALQPDYMGFIYYGLSPRYVGDIVPKTFKDIPAGIHTTAVFVNEKMDLIKKLINTYSFDTVQLHGTESPEFADEVRSRATVLKAFGISEDFDFDRLKEYEDAVDFFLFDAKTQAYGGSGKTFKWRLLNQYRLNIPFFISGGLSVQNLPEVLQIQHPQLYGVDLNSRFETEPGLKDIEKLKEAFQIIRSW